jgi:hypothetical protein
MTRLTNRLTPGGGPSLRRRVLNLILGPPLPSWQDKEERLSNPAALAILSSDALSSVAYATEEMVKVLLPVVGLVAFSYVMPISGIIILLLLTLIFSYRQTIRAYPSAGGAYIVTRDNFGLTVAQVAGVALLLDYVLTVAVSIAAGVAAIYSAFPVVFVVRVPLTVMLIWFIAWVNLRGVRMTGRVFVGGPLAGQRRLRDHAAGSPEEPAPGSCSGPPTDRRRDRSARCHRRRGGAGGQPDRG